MDIKTNLQELFQNEKEAFFLNSYSQYSERITKLKILRSVIVNNQSIIITAVNQDFGCRPQHETQTLEIFPCLDSIDYAIKNLKKWLKPRKHKASKWFWPSKCSVLPVPLGVIGIISPWNYPLFLTIAPLVAALAAGNRALIKMSESVPNLASLLKRLLENNNLAKVIVGDADIASHFSQLPFDHLFFTGSTTIGKKIMQAASTNLTRLTLELGGKSPAIICSHELKIDYINKLWLGKILNAGQTCIAPDYVFLPKGLSNQLLSDSIACQQVEQLDIATDQYCSIINETNYNRLLSLIDDAEQKGATWHPLKYTNNSWCSNKDDIYKISPGLLFNVNNTMQVMQQEIFGPILPVVEYNDIDKLVISLQLMPSPLALYLFTENPELVHKLCHHSRSGALSINATVLHAAQESLPFGGIGNSGIGCYRGQYGFETFSHLKPIYKHSQYNIFTKFYPPVKKWQKLMLKYLLK